MLKSSFSLTLLLLCVLLGFSACDDDEDTGGPRLTVTLADLVVEDARFSTLLSALTRTGLDVRLANPNDLYTVFAPTDAAFEAAGVDLASLSDDELTDILNYHLIEGSILGRTADLPEGDQQLNTRLRTFGDNQINLPVNRSGTTLTFAGTATSTGEPVRAANGAIYPIDGLLLPPSIAGVASREGNFTTLLKLLVQTGLDTVLANSGTYTVFAPTDAAFTAADLDTDNLDDEAIRQLLSYHVLGTGVAAGSIPAGQSFQTTLSMASPDESMLSVFIDNGDNVVLNGSATVVSPNQFATNGVVHVIDEVLSMQSVTDFAVLSGELDSLTGALMTAELVDDLSEEGPFTVFAPVNSAFALANDTIMTFSTETLATVLLHHVAGGNVRSSSLMDGMEIETLSEGTLTVSTMKEDGSDRSAPVLMTYDSTEVGFIMTDVQATNGVIHLIDGILLPELE